MSMKKEKRETGEVVGGKSGPGVDGVGFVGDDVSSLDGWSFPLMCEQVNRVSDGCRVAWSVQTHRRRVHREERLSQS